MNFKPLFIASLIVVSIVAMALEGGALHLGQAVVVLVPASLLAAWSFTKTDWYNPMKGSEKDGRYNR